MLFINFVTAFLLLWLLPRISCTEKLSPDNVRLKQRKQKDFSPCPESVPEANVLIALKIQERRTRKESQATK